MNGVHTMPDDVPEEKMTIIMDVVKELVIDKGVPQSWLYREITSRLKQLCTDKVRILYNTRYGGFGFNNEFKQFAKLENDDEYYRTDMCEPIQSFGKYIATEYPVLFNMVYTYYALHDELSPKFANCHLYKCDKDTLDILQHNLGVLYTLKQTHGGTAHMNENWKVPSEGNNMYRISYRKLQEDKECMNIATDTYTVDEVIKYTEGEVLKYQEKVADRAATIDNACLQTLMKKFPQEIHIHNMYFLKAIKEYGVEHVATWKYQKMLNETHIRHMILHKSHISACDDDDDVVRERCYETIGLLCASDEYASLKFAEVPKGISYSIREYDGREFVVVD